MTLRLVATVNHDNSIKNFLAPNESMELKGGEKFVTMTKSEAEDVLGRPVEFDEFEKPVLNDGDLESLTAHCKLRSQLSGMTSRNQRRLLRKMRAEHERKIAPDLKRLDFLRKAIAAMEELEKWVREPPLLEKPAGSRFHKFMEAASIGELIVLKDVRNDDSNARSLSKHTFDVWKDATVFVVEHDWASAFSKATDYLTGEYRLPDTVCAFEFRISGYHVIALANQDETGGPIDIYPMVQVKDGTPILIPWGYNEKGEPTDSERVAYEDRRSCDSVFSSADLIISQIRAVAIALDASVAQTSVVSADRKLNHARERRGHLPIYDYHVVSLANRARARPIPVEPGEHGGVRKALHFVRGHRRNIDAHDEQVMACTPHQWTAYDTDSRSNCTACNARSRWINWHLRGDPDLGFIDKHYKL